MPQKQKLNGRKLNKQGLKYQYEAEKVFCLHFQAFHFRHQILYSQCFVYIFKALRLYRQSITSIQTKRFEYKIYTENPEKTHELKSF